MLAPEREAAAETMADRRDDDSADRGARGPSLGWRKQFEYALPSLSLATAGVMTGTFVPKLYSDTYGISLSALGWISFSALTFDAFTDPAVGFASDFTRSRWGRRRPFILAGGLGLSAVSLALLSPPVGLQGGAVLAWATCCFLLIVLAGTCVRVPWLALGMELTTGEHEGKTTVFATREVVWILGTVLAAGMPLAVAIEDEALQFRVIGVVVAILALVTTMVCVCTVREPRYDTLPEREGSLASGCCSIFAKYWILLLTLLRSRSGASLLATGTLYGGAVYLNSFYFAYFIEYAVDAEDSLELILILYIVCGVICVPGWVWLGKRFEKARLIRLAMASQSAVLLVAFAVVQPGDVALYAALVVPAGMSFGAYSMFRFSMLGDLADLDEWAAEDGHTVRREGEIQGLFDLCSKLLSALLIGPSLIVLDSVGYAPNEAQTDEARLAIRALYGLVPGLLGILALITLAPYDLTRAKHARAQAAFKAGVGAEG